MHEKDNFFKFEHFLLMEEISYTFWTGAVAPVSVDILWKGIIIMKIFTKSDRYMLEQPKIIIISKFYQTHAKISKPTGATAPVEKVKEISSNMIFYLFLSEHIL